MKLADINSDFASISQSLRAELQSKDTFKAIFPGETGNALVELGAGILAMLLYRLDINLLNQFMPTAFSKSAVYTLASMLGSPPYRKIGAVVTLQATLNSVLTSTITLPELTRLSARGLQWYTTSPTVILPGSSTFSFEVTQGTLATVTYSSNGLAYQSIYLGSGFSIEQSSVRVYVNGSLWTKGTVSLAECQGLNAYLETTTPDGQVLLLFGNGLYGNIPVSGASISIVYATTSGISANTSTINDQFSLIDMFTINGDPSQFLDLTVVSSSSTSGGDNEESPEQVKFTSPRIFASNSRAVRRQDYNAYVLQSGGLISANCWGEYEQALERGYADNSMMNRGYISALKSTLTTPTQTIGTGDGTDTSFSGTISSGNLPIIPGSVTVTAGSVVFRDYDGLGYLTSFDVDFNQVTGGVASATNSNSSYPVVNVADNTDVSWWRSNSLPTNTSPIRVGYTFASALVIGSIRLQSAPGLTQTDRAFPNKISIWGSNVTTPSYATDTDWTLLRGGIFLSDPGSGGLTDWVPISNETLYTSLCIKIESVHGNSPYVQIAEIQAQQLSDMSTVNYTTGEISVKYSTPPSNLTNVLAQVISTDLSSTKITDMFAYLRKYIHFTTQLSYVSPVARQFNLIIDVYVDTSYSTTEVQSSALTSISQLFSYSNNSIGKMITLSDIYNAVTNVSGVDYCVIQSPRVDSYAYRDQFPYLQSTILNMYYTSRS